ncbi:MAG: hypothetical protein WC942_11575, partial [Clostridia bacterium]
MKTSRNIYTDLSSLVDKKIEKYKTGDELYEEFPVDILTFVTSPDFLDWDEFLYPGIREILEDFLVFEGDWLKYREGIVVAGMGTGKSRWSALVLTYLVYRLLCFRTPQKFFQKPEEDTIQLVNCAPSGDQANKVVFAYISDSVNSCKWFKDRGYLPNPRVESELQFPKGIYVTPGSSSAKPVLGKNLLVAIIDEMALFDVTRERDEAQVLFEQFEGRMKSRFPNEYVIIGISTAETDDSFIENRFKVCKGEPLKRFAKRLAFWESRPNLFSGKFFSYKVSDVAGKEIETLQVPIELKKELETNTTKFLRDVAGRP